MIATERAHLQVAVVTHPGMKGKNNEDRYAVSAHRLGGARSLPSLLAVVADGVGGHRAGEVAAEMAVEIVSRTVAESDAGQPVSILSRAIAQANQAIYAQALANPAQQGMSTTCACAWVIGDRLYTASVGDSRIYLIRNGDIRQLTTDHTWVQEAVESGALTPEQARSHPNAHVIRRHLGSQQPVAPDFRLRLSLEEGDERAEANQGVRLLPGDCLLLCSDGLTDLVTDGEILEAMTSRRPREGLEHLVALANYRGGHDNITIVCLQKPSRAAEALLVGRARPRPALWLALGLIAVLFLSLLTAGGLFWLRGGAGAQETPTDAPIPLLRPSLAPLEAGAATSTPPETARRPTQATPPSSATPPAGESAPAIRPTYTPWPTSTLPGGSP